MRSFLFFAALLGSAIAAPLTTRDNGWTGVDPGWIDDIVITKENTLNGTYAPKNTDATFSTQAARLPLSLVNNFSGGSVNAYVTGLDPAGRVVFLSPSGNWVYPSSGGSAVPVPVTGDITLRLPSKGGSLSVTLPDYITSGRVWFAEGDLKFFVVSVPGGEGLVTPSHVNQQDPSAGINWGFVELSNVANGGIWANVSYVDFVGMILGIMVRDTSGGEQLVQGLQSGALTNICNELKSQGSSDGRPWSSMCFASNGKLMRAISPNNYNDVDPNGFSTYWQSYVDQVWAKYTTTPLTINTQSIGHVNCQVSGSTMNCAGDNRGYTKPAAKDIWGCNNGPFANDGVGNAVHQAVVPRLCAALVRSTLLLAGGNVQPSLSSSSYYTVNPTNHYSRLVHKYLRGGRGYAFSFDDVNPNSENAAGLIQSPNPALLTIYAGGAP